MATDELPACGTTPIQDHETALQDPPSDLTRTAADADVVRAACDALEDRAQSRWVALHLMGGGPTVAASEPKSAYSLGRVDGVLMECLRKIAKQGAAGAADAHETDPALLLDRIPPRGWWCSRQAAIAFVRTQADE